MKQLTQRTVCLITVILLSGCGQTTEIREYVAEREIDRVVTTDVLRDEFPTLPFEWPTVEGWRTAENDQFSLVAWTAGPKTSEARITVSNVNAASGIEAQVARWRGQIGMPEVSDPEELKKGLSEIRLGEVTGTWVELKGGAETILAMLIPFEDKLWVFRYRSSNETATLEAKSFRGWCEAIHTKD
jgi:hypothetical protein